MKTVTIAIPSLHRPDLTSRCLQSIQAQTLPADEWEVVIIENEACPEQILPDPLPANARRIELPDNQGTTGSINRCSSETESRYILLLNNDVELAPDYLAKLVKTLDADPTVGFATGKLRRATRPTHLDGAGDAMLMAGAAYRLGHQDPDTGQFDEPLPVLSACGAAVLYRREAFEASGRLDEDFFAYLDDLDLALRVQLLGYSGAYRPDAVAYHVGSATSGSKTNAFVVELVTRNQLFLLTKDYPRPVLLRLLPRVIVYQALWLIYAIQNDCAGAWLRGLWAGLRGARKMGEKHHDLMAKRRVTYGGFLKRLRASERQIYDWQQTAASRSSLLKLYFGLFGKPKTPGNA